MNQSALLTSYTENGFALVPIPAGEKSPRHSGWNERSNVITTAEGTSGITGNVGLAHAYCTPTSTVAIDIDSTSLARPWLKERGVDLDALITADDAVLIESGRENRAKLLSRLPADTPPLKTVTVSDPVSGEMVLEFRCGTGNQKTVQDVLPPSIHPSTGQPYRWAGKGHFSRVPTLPSDLLKVWNGLLMEGQHGQAREQSSLFSEPETPRGIANVRNLLAHISADCSYQTYRDVVWAVAHTGWSCAEELLQEWSLTAPHRYEEHTLDALLNSYSPDRGIHYGTLVYHARKGGWNGHR